MLLIDEAHILSSERGSASLLRGHRFPIGDIWLRLRIDPANVQQAALAERTADNGDTLTGG